MPASINIGYYIQRAYFYFTAPHGAAGAGAPAAPGFSFDGSALVSLIQSVEVAALGLSVILLILFVFIYYRFLQYEHAGWHYRQEQEIAAMTAQVEAPKNDRFEQVVELANSAHPSDWRRAILEGDIMLGELLEERGFPGADVGERLRGASRAHFQTLDLAWEAHRVRNQIAHEGETFPLTERDALAAVEKYRRVFEEFGYL